MVIIGERINTVRKDVASALERREAEFFHKEALKQVQAGADVIDINAGSNPQEESSNMKWLVSVVCEVVNVPLCIDSPNPEVIKAGFIACRKKNKVWANSITAQKERIEKVIPLVKEYGCPLVGLCMDEDGIPDTVQGRIEVAEKLVKVIDGYGIHRENFYLDPLIEPISVQPQRAMLVLDVIRGIKTSLEKVKTIICLSAVSFGLPNRRLVNRTFLPSLIYAGIDAVILDPLDEELMAALKSANALFGQDKDCIEYITAYREGRLGGKETRRKIIK